MFASSAHITSTTAGSFMRDFTSPNDYFLCRRDNSEPTGDGNCERFYVKEKHVFLPFYDEKRWEVIKSKQRDEE